MYNIYNHLPEFDVLFFLLGLPGDVPCLFLDEDAGETSSTVYACTVLGRCLGLFLRTFVPAVEARWERRCKVLVEFDLIFELVVL